MTLGKRLATKPQNTAHIRRMISATPTGGAIPPGVRLASSDRRESGGTQRGPCFAFLGVGDDAPGTEFPADAPHRSVERRVGIAGAVCAGTRHFQGVATVVEQPSHRTADDGNSHEVVGALNADADREFVTDRTAVVAVVLLDECLGLAQGDDLSAEAWSASAHSSVVPRAAAATVRPAAPLRLGTTAFTLVTADRACPRRYASSIRAVPRSSPYRRRLHPLDGR